MPSRPRGRSCKCPSAMSGCTPITKSPATQRCRARLVPLSPRSLPIPRRAPAAARRAPTFTAAAGTAPAAASSSRCLAIGNSLGALILGRDDGDYFRATGAEVTVVPAVTLARRFSIRLYAERQRRAFKRTDFSLPHAFDQQDLFRPNVMADSADQLGAVLAFRAQRGMDPEHTQWSTDVTIAGGTGTYDFGRASTTLRATATLEVATRGSAVH